MNLLMTLTPRGKYKRVSQEEKERIVALVRDDNGYDIRQVAQMNGDARTTIITWINSGVSPNRPRGGAINVKITADISEYIQSTIDDDCWITLEELSEKIHQMDGQNWPEYPHLHCPSTY